MSNEDGHFRCIKLHTHIRKDRLVALGLIVKFIEGVIQGQCFTKPKLKVIITQFFTSQHLRFSFNPH